MNTVEFKGKSYRLSEEIYEIINNSEHSVNRYSTDYKDGTKVKLISGVKGRDIVGYNSDEEYFTVCRLEATDGSMPPEFIGIKKEKLKLVYK